MFFEMPAEIQVKKDLTYTVTPIGGPKAFEAYLNDKRERLMAKETAKKESYSIRKMFLEDIVLGDKPASKDTTVVPPTFILWAAEKAGRPVSAMMKVDIEMGEPQGRACCPLPGPHPPRFVQRWFNNVRDYFKATR